MANGTLPAGAVAPTQSGQTGSKAAVNLIESLLNQPSLPVGTTITPTPQQVQTGELMATPGVTGAVTATSFSGSGANLTNLPASGLNYAGMLKHF